MRVKFVSTEFLICACSQIAGIALPWDSDLPLFSLCWYFIHLPLWLPCWHMNAAFNFFFLSLCMEVYAAFWNRNFHNCSSSSRNTTQSCLLNSQCGQAPSAPRSGMEGEGNRCPQKHLWTPSPDVCSCGCLCPKPRSSWSAEMGSLNRKGPQHLHLAVCL